MNLKDKVLACLSTAFIDEESFGATHSEGFYSYEYVAVSLFTKIYLHDLYEGDFSKIATKTVRRVLAILDNEMKIFEEDEVQFEILVQSTLGCLQNTLYESVLCNRYHGAKENYKEHYVRVIEHSYFEQLKSFINDKTLERDKREAEYEVRKKAIMERKDKEKSKQY